MRAKAAVFSPANQAMLILAGAGVTFIGSRLMMPLPYTPVPVTWQTAGVMFAGLALGSRIGMLSQLFYLIAGFAGAPVFAGGGGAAWLFNPHGTGGYLLAFPLAAWLIGRISEKYGQKNVLISFLACLAGIGLIHLLGCGWLSFYGHLRPIAALLMGSVAFIFWDIAKAFVVIGLLNMKKQAKNS